jgi:hypothetical protein
MKVKELIEILSTMDQDREVILQRDSEGNGYSPLCGVDDNTVYESESTSYGEVYHEKLTEEDRKQGFTEEDLGTGNGVPCVVLFPS